MTNGILKTKAANPQNLALSNQVPVTCAVRLFMSIPTLPRLSEIPGISPQLCIELHHAAYSLSRGVYAREIGKQDKLRPRLKKVEKI